MASQAYSDLAEKLLELGGSAAKKTMKAAAAATVKVGKGAVEQTKDTVIPSIFGLERNNGANYTPLTPPEQWHQKKDQKDLESARQKLAGQQQQKEQEEWSAFHRYRRTEEEYHEKRKQEEQQKLEQQRATLEQQKREKQQEEQNFTPLDTGSKPKRGGRPGTVRKKAKTAETRVGQGKQ